MTETERSLELDRLRREAADSQLGVAWLEFVYRVARRVTGKGREDVSDLVMEVFSQRLVQGRADYIAQNCVDLDHAEHLLIAQIRQVQWHEWTPSAVDRVLRRLDPLLEDALGRFQEPIPGFGDSSVVGTDTADRRRAASREVGNWPRLPDRGEERSSKIFTTETLITGISGLREAFRGGCSLEELRDALSDALTIYRSTRFVADEEFWSQESEPGLGPEELSMVDALVTEARAALSQEQLGILALDLAGVVHTDQSVVFGISRPTLQKRRDDARAKLRGILRDVPEAIASRALRELLDAGRGEGI